MRPSRLCSAARVANPKSVSASAFRLFVAGALVTLFWISGATAQNALTQPYLMSFDSCPTASGCVGPMTQTLHLVQGDGVNWQLVTSLPTVMGSVPAIIRRGTKIYIIYGGPVVGRSLLRYDMSSGTWSGPLSFSLTTAGDGTVVDETVNLNAQGQIVITFWSVNPDGDGTPCPQASCARSLRQATEVAGSDGTQFVETSTSIVSILNNMGATTADPFIFQDASQFNMYVGVPQPAPQAPEIRLYTSTVLSGPYSLSNALPNGVVFPNSIGQMAGFYHAARDEYWDYINNFSQIELAVTTSLSQQVSLMQFTPVLDAAALGLGSNLRLQHPHFAKNWNGIQPPVAAVLPASRSIQVGNTATAFASIINTDTVTAADCFVGPLTQIPGTFSYQTTDPATNQLTGTPNTPVSVPSNGVQSFVFAITPSAPFSPTDVQLTIGCASTANAAPIVGVNTLLLSASSMPVPDMIAVGLTPSNDGYSHTGGPNGTGLFVIASTNIGVSASLTARARVSNASLPLTTFVCQTNPSTGQCLSPPTPTATATINQNQNTTWSSFLQANGTIPQDPANNRVFFEFVDAGGIVRGSTSTAVTSQ